MKFEKTRKVFLLIFIGTVLWGCHLSLQWIVEDDWVEPSGYDSFYYDQKIGSYVGEYDHYSYILRTNWYGTHSRISSKYREFGYIDQTDTVLGKMEGCSYLLKYDSGFYKQGEFCYAEVFYYKRTDGIIGIHLDQIHIINKNLIDIRVFDAYDFLKKNPEEEWQNQPIQKIEI
jgi:hypothetical protein